MPEDFRSDAIRGLESLREEMPLDTRLDDLALYLGDLERRLRIAHGERPLFFI